MLVQLCFRPSGGDVCPHHSYLSPGVHGYNHALSPTQPWVTRPGSVFSVKTVNAWCGVLNVYAGVHPFTAGPRSFSDGWPPLLFVSSLLLGRQSHLLDDSRVSLLGLFMFPSPIVISLPFVWAVIFEVPRLSTITPCSFSCISSRGGGRSAPPELPGTRFMWPNG
jgi:hypothetical protein